MTNCFSLAVHGGAGTVLRSQMTAKKEHAYHGGLKDALQAGYDVLKQGGSATDAVISAVCVLEDDPLFNAGRGAVFTTDGTHEMDAAVMEGTRRHVGAVAGICGPRNPVKVAQMIMKTSDHVFFGAKAAMDMARAAGLPFEEMAYFHTQSRWDALQETLKMRAAGRENHDPARQHGTVGAVARDMQGHLAAATSTGGMTAKAPGRIGDSPLIGAGTFADDKTCAVSATGHGEVFIRYGAAHEIAARMRHLGESLSAAAGHVVMQDLAKNDGSGGLVAVDREGIIAMPMNCEGMYRGSVTQEARFETFIYAQD